MLSFYEKKSNKIITENLIEIDNQDLELFGDYEEHKEFSNVSSNLIGGKTLPEWFAFDDISYWWFIYPTIYSKFNEAALFINQFLSFLEKKRIKKIKLYGNYDKLSLIKEICNNKNIELELSQKNYFSFQIRQYVKNLLKPLVYKKTIDTKTKKRLNCYNQNTKKTLPKKSSVIITSPGIYRRYMSDYKTGQAKKQEFILQPILDLLHENQISTICFDLDYTFHGETEALEERLRNQHIWKPIEILLREPVSTKTKKTLTSIHNSFKKFKKSHPEETFIYDGISLWKFLEPKFEEIFLKPYLPTYLHLLEKIEKFLTKYRPNTIIQIYETGPYAKSFQLPAQKLGIKTIGLQHGIIYDGNPDYAQQIIKNEKNPLGNPIPDLTLVFGKYYKKILTEKCGYPENTVEIMGNPSFYNIDKVKSKLSKAQILKKYQLDDKKIILVPLSFRSSQKIPNNPDDLLLDALIQNIKNQNDTLVLIRPHPGDYDNIYSKLKKRHTPKNFVVSKGSLFEDIIVSDLIVTTISTVGIDATIFEKPVFLVDITGKASESLGGIHKEMIDKNVALHVSLNALISKLSSIEKGQLWKTRDSENRKNFVNSYFNYGQETDLLNLIYDVRNFQNIEKK